jgi:Fibrinogen beta and gamma chains, C-terminal globular domain
MMSPGTERMVLVMRTCSKLALCLSVVTACSVDKVTFMPGEALVENCAVAGDEDGNGVADCADPGCAGAPACQSPACTPEVCDGLDNDCSGTADDHEALGTARACAPASCAELRDHNPASTDGVWWIDPSGGDPFEAYCDMTNGGWTLVMNQVPGADLPDEQVTVNPAAFGSLDHSYRLGNPTITAIKPASAWRLSDAMTQVFFSPTCVVDWSIDYLDRPASPCTTGYTTEQLTTAYNGGHINVSTRGIGINNSARFCSMRAYNTLTTGSLIPGPATTCLYARDQIVQLWYR